jgi:hypothetical protein
MKIVKTPQIMQSEGKLCQQTQQRMAGVFLD